MSQDFSFEKITPEDFFDSGDLKVLICYVLSALNEPVPATETAQLFHYEGIANYFDVQTALADLEKSGHITAVDGTPELYRITPQGVSLSATLRESVSATLRAKAYNAVVKMLARYKTERDTDIEITQGDSGFTLTCLARSGDTVLFSFSLLLPNEAQALALRERILTDPKYYYDSFIALLTEELPSESNTGE